MTGHRCNSVPHLILKQSFGRKIVIQFHSQSMFDIVSMLSALFFTTAIAWSDHRNFRIPNRWVYAFGMVSVVLAIWRSMRGYAQSADAGQMLFDWPSLTSAILGFVIALAFTHFFWKRGWMGGGDVKLAAALGLCVGCQHVLHVLLITLVVAFLIIRLDSFFAYMALRFANRDLSGANQSEVSMGPFFAASLLCIIW
jgi:Flp pilus assembly protein protease CpaA